jgi:hypothetical protein
VIRTATVVQPVGVVDEHAAPASVTIEQAHALMREHLRCASTNCPARQKALGLLVAARRYVLSTNAGGRCCGSGTAHPDPSPQH